MLTSTLDRVFFGVESLIMLFIALEPLTFLRFPGGLIAPLPSRRARSRL